jgi:hypothetical protein
LGIGAIRYQIFRLWRAVSSNAPIERNTKSRACIDNMNHATLHLLKMRSNYKGSQSGSQDYKFSRIQNKTPMVVYYVGIVYSNQALGQLPGACSI